jgi:hypothetical protein
MQCLADRRMFSLDWITKLSSVQAGLTVVSLIFLVGTSLICLLATFETDLIKTHIPIISGWKGKDVILLSHFLVNQVAQRIDDDITIGLGIYQIFLAALTLSTLGPVLKLVLFLSLSY